MTDIELMANMVYGEARGEPISGKIAVASTVINRVNLSKRGVTWWGDTITSVILKPYQYQGLFTPSPNQMNTRDYQECLSIAEAVIVFKAYIKDITHFCGLGYSFDKLIYCFTIGNHKFYKEKYESFNLSNLV